ncbi:MAG: adenylate/guanylate cyclase [Verrucomicrobia bacterium]|nr:adenylate/guanylate cyclase [Verrucomicrobiota bacterium]
MSTTNVIELKPSTLRLEVTYRDDTQRYEFEGKEVVIGRPNPYLPPTLDLSEDILVSRTHARIWVNVDGYWIEDLVSKHGTFVNGGRLTLRRQLNPGDFIQIGETTLKVLCPAPTRKAEPAKPLNDEEISVDSALAVEETALGKVAADAGGQIDPQVELLLELPLKLASQTNMASLTKYVVNQLPKLIPGVERAAVLLINSDTAELMVAASLPAEDPPVSRTLALRAVKEGRALIWRKVIDGVESQSMRRLEMKVGMYAPLVWGDRTVGVICVDNPKRDCRFSERELRLLMTVAAYTAMAVSFNRLKEAL